MNTKHFRRSALRRAGAGSGILLAALVLVACGGDDGGSAHHGGDGAAPSASGSPSADGRHNAADVSFAQGMIPHHRQALDMAELALDRAASNEVRSLAEQVRAAQAPEIETLTGWLTEWGEEIPEEGTNHSDMEHSGTTTDGMMSEEDLAELESSSGAAFDTAFLEMMIEHHEGAITMAETERDQGAFPAARDMAEDIVSSQDAEIDEMNALLDRR